MFRRRARPGFNLIEVAVAIATAAVVLLALGNFIVAAFKANGNERDRTFAMQRALQMMDEIASYRDSDVITQFADATNAYSFQMTTKSTAVAHGELSGNPRVNGNYKYVRHIDVVDVDNEKTAKRVTISIYYAKPGATPGVKTGQGKPLAVVSNILRIASGGAGSTQTYDVYVISIENLPHVYRRSDADDTTRKTYFPSATEARLAFEQAIRTFAAQTPGLELRTHFITRLSKGRDERYRPYINDAKGVDNDTQKWAYFYPGKLKDAEDSPRYFDLQAFNGNVLQGNSSSDPVAPSPAVYPLADQFNHAVMYGGEHNYSQGPIATPSIPPGAPNTDTMSGQSLRQYHDYMLTDTTGKYRNAIIVNLHGELFPALPLRNYSDAAKDPDDSDTDSRKRRIVTHPYRLNTGTTTSDTVRLLVHPYMEGGGKTPDLGGERADVTSDVPSYAKNARIWIRDLKPRLRGGSLNDIKVYMVQRERDEGKTHITSGVWLGDFLEPGNGDKTFYTYVQAWPYGSPGADDEEMDPGRLMHSGPHLGRSQLLSTHIPLGNALKWDGNDLVMDLCDLDYDARSVVDGGEKYGLGSDVKKFRLHGLQYFPDPWLPLLDADNADKYVRNTARVVIEFQVTGTGRYEVVTALRPSFTSSTDWANLDLSDLSYPWYTKTWFYAGYSFSSDMGLYWDTTNWKPSIPWSDQVQLVGDPRHNPLDDARDKKLYNPYFTDWTAGKKEYNEVENTSGKKIDLGNGWGTIPITATTTPGKGKGKPKAVKAFPDLSFTDSAASWNGVKYNAPMYFRMWREALYRNSALFVNVAGQPLGYLGLGGEFCLEGQIDDLASIQSKQAIYTGATGSGNGKDEFKDLVPNIVHDNTGVDWVAKPWIGELYPSWAYSGTDRWEGKGNLSTKVKSSGDDFRRLNLEDPAVKDYWDEYADREDDDNRKIVNGGNGLYGLLFNSASSGAVTTQQATETTTVSTGPGADWEQLVQSRFQTLNTRWPYKLTGGSGPEGSSYPSAFVENAAWLNSGGAYVQRDASNAAARPIVETGNSITGAPADRAWIFFANALRPDSAFELSRVFETAVFGMVASYHDGIKNSLKKGAMRPMPRLEITGPAHAATVTASPVTVTVERAWLRPDKGVYSPNSTYNDAQTVDNGGPDDMIYFIKYRNLTDGNWRLAAITSPVSVSDASAVPGDLPPSSVNAIKPARTATTFTASWTLPNTTTMPDGEYLLRVEGFRLDQASPQNRIQNHQAYHEVKIIVDR